MPSNTARIAKNTLLLYFRQILILLVSLYTVRVVLETLGAEDYGIYNVVAGLVIMFTFLNTAMTHATQRFLNFALGQNDTEQARNVYSASFVIHALIAVLVIILAQTVGLWFFYTWLNLPPERQTAAFVVYQFTVASAAINIFQIPYKATIIAYEKMSFFALLSIIEAVFKLGIVFLLPVILLDTLMVYAFLVCITGIIILLIHIIYCNKTFEIAHYKHCKDKKLFQQLLGFFSWNVVGGLANISRNHGTNILLNIFYGVTVNAAMGVAMQVNSAVNQFVSAYQTAYAPQMTKTYAAKDYNYFMQLVLQSCKISFYLLFFFALPLLINSDFILNIWLKNTPEYTIELIRLMLICCLVDVISGPLWMSMQASGDIKKYQIFASLFIFSNVPLSLFFLWSGYGPSSVLILRIGIAILYLTWNIIFLNRKISFPVKGFIFEVIVPILIITAVSVSFSFISHTLFVGWQAVVVSCAVSIISIGSLVCFIGLNKEEKKRLNGYIKDFLKNKLKSI